MSTADIEYENYSDELGRPAGGYVQAIGLRIDWQRGPLRVVKGSFVDREGHETDTYIERSGAFVEDVIEAAITRIEYYQQSEFHCLENAVALGHLQAAREALRERTMGREDRGVEGTHNV